MHAVSDACPSSFCHLEVDVETLGDLEYSHLSDMGITAVGARLKILKVRVMVYVNQHVG